MHIKCKSNSGNRDDLESLIDTDNHVNIIKMFYLRGDVIVDEAKERIKMWHNSEINT